MKRLVLAVCALTMLAACGTNQARESEKAIRAKADYWQRSDSVSAQYLTGPKAQHQLHMDIAACVAEVRELVRLGSIRRAEPPRNLGLTPGLQQGWQSPTRDGPLYTEYTSYQDFDGCMKHKGWDRVDYVRPAVADHAAGNYTTTILGHPFGWTGSSRRYEGDTSDNNFNR